MKIWVLTLVPVSAAVYIAYVAWEGSGYLRGKAESTISLDYGQAIEDAPACGLRTDGP